MARLLMCRPDFFGIRYEINPWMRTTRDAAPERAAEQWRGLHQTLTRRVGAAVELVEPVEGWPDMVFTANAGLVDGRTFLASNFRYPQRAGEERHFRAWFADRGYTCVQMPEHCHFEGEGDALWARRAEPDGAARAARGDRTLLAGYRFRSDVDSHARVGELLGCEVISLELVDQRFYHLDTCLAPLGDGSAIIYPPAFEDYGLRALSDRLDELIELEEGEALRFAANAVVVGRSVVLNAGCSAVGAALADRGYEVHETPLDEFMKAGGAAKCLALFLEP